MWRHCDDFIHTRDVMTKTRISSILIFTIYLVQQTSSNLKTDLDDSLFETVEFENNEHFDLLSDIFKRDAQDTDSDDLDKKDNPFDPRRLDHDEEVSLDLEQSLTEDPQPNSGNKTVVGEIFGAGNLVPKEGPEWNSGIKDDALDQTQSKHDIRDWAPEAIVDIAYFLRDHKFNDYDRRYPKPDDELQRGFMSEFPVPPLKTFHWQVYDQCEKGFLECIRYLQDKTFELNLQRLDDPFASKQKTNDTGKQIQKCKSLQKLDEDSYQGFTGDLDRFQWRTTASYYMCYFTMQEEPLLKYFNTSCANTKPCEHFSSLGPADWRSDDRVPFACARYSFCPDPCCPLLYTENSSVCSTSEKNACNIKAEFQDHSEVVPVPENCQLMSGKNKDITGITLNYWNTSCGCVKPGYVWEAEFGLCIDENECLSNPCENDTRGRTGCVNILGSFLCKCPWGTEENATSVCSETQSMKNILAPISVGVNDFEKPAATKRSWFEWFPLRSSGFF